MITVEFFCAVCSVCSPRAQLWWHLGKPAGEVRRPWNRIQSNGKSYYTAGARARSGSAPVNQVGFPAVGGVPRNWPFHFRTG